jgi:hypothetical protein
VWVRWDGRIVRVFNDRLELIATHVRHEPGQSKHIASEKISGMERGAAWLLSQTQRIGPQAARWSEAVVQARGVEGVRVLQGLLAQQFVKTFLLFFSARVIQSVNNIRHVQPTDLKCCDFCLLNVLVTAVPPSVWVLEKLPSASRV